METGKLSRQESPGSAFAAGTTTMRATLLFVSSPAPRGLFPTPYSYPAWTTGCFVVLVPPYILQQCRTVAGTPAVRSSSPRMQAGVLSPPPISGGETAVISVPLAALSAIPLLSLLCSALVETTR